MNDSGAILCQISYLKDMLDQVNEEIEANIQTTREIESEIVKCSEYESALAMRESELTKMKCLAEFEMDGFIQVAAVARASLEVLEKELNCLRMTREEAMKRISDKREAFIMLCEGFQRDIIRGGNEELSTLLSKKEVLENETYNLIMKDNALRNSMSAFAKEIIEELRTYNSALNAVILRGNFENEKLLEEIDDLKSSLIATSLYENHPR